MHPSFEPFIQKDTNTVERSNMTHIKTNDADSKAIIYYYTAGTNYTTRKLEAIIT